MNVKLIALVSMSLFLLACEKQGPLERAGEKVDNAAHDLKNGGETVGDKVGDAADDVRDAAKKAARDAK